MYRLGDKETPKPTEHMNIVTLFFASTSPFHYSILFLGQGGNRVLKHSRRSKGWPAHSLEAESVFGWGTKVTPSAIHVDYCPTGAIGGSLLSLSG